MTVIATSIEAKLKYYKECVFKYNYLISFSLTLSKVKFLFFRHDYVEVLHYLITTKKLDPLEKDDHNRTFIFLAVMNDQSKILNYLIKRVRKIFFFTLFF